jgi:5-methylcytosine-specific restriction endonuclease McrA
MVCEICGGATPPPKPKGQPPKYCSDGCRLTARRQQREAFVAAHPELARERNRLKVTKWRRTQNETFTAYRRKHYSERKERISAQRRSARAENPEPERVYRRQRYEKNRDKFRAQRLKNYREREHLRIANQIGSARRKARLLAAFVEDVDPRVVFERADGVCGICSKPVDRESNWEVDHVVPLARGGEHSYANTQLAHRKCNRAKGARVDGQVTDGVDARAPGAHVYGASTG